MENANLEELLQPFLESEILKAPEKAFKGVKNKFFQLEIPYTHLMVFSSLQIESNLYELRKAMNFPYFHCMGPNGKSVFIESNGAKRLVVDFVFEDQIEIRAAHYGHLLKTYIHVAQTIVS